ncbi:MAG TPA: TIGR02391 family protein [Candidatus Sulfotelmatobacter sp.]|nr:TIGR02391 family protein [Candidatus Sulfotelmatobacter sp.]
MPVSLSSLVPNPTDLLSLEVEELAGVLLVHLNSYGDGGSSVVQQGLISSHNFFNGLDHQPEYPGRQPEVSRALMEAWSWLQGEGFLVRQPEQPADWFFLSRRARTLKSREDFAAYRKANLLPKGQLHELIATRVYPAFLRGEYDTAVFQAFREIEIAVRKAGKFPDDLVGKELMREALRPANSNKPTGPLTDTALPVAEQEGMASLFAGAIGLYKNPQSHRNVPTDPVDAAEVIVFASHLLRIVDRLSQP